jgi:hypothetical protein
MIAIAFDNSSRATLRDAAWNSCRTSTDLRVDTVASEFTDHIKRTIDVLSHLISCL